MLTAALIAAFACPGPPAVLVDRRPGEVRTTVVACDGDRRVVVRRARLRPGGSGTRIVAAAGAGPWVAWGELRWARGRVRAAVSRSRIGGRARVLYVGFSRATPPRIELVVTSRGGAAWLIGRSVYTTRGFGRYTTSAWRSPRGPLVLEEDRTVRWREPGGRLGFEDLHPAPCQPRPGYGVVGEDESMLVTGTVYDGRLRVVRTCRRTDLYDPVIVQLRTDSGERLDLVGLDAPWVLFTRTAPDGSCTVETYHPDHSAGQVRPVACERAPRAGTTPFVVSSGGVPAWIVERPGRSMLLMQMAERTLELDATGPGGITGLSSEGTEVRWLHEGQPRSVALHP